MRVLLIGAGGVGSAVVPIAARRGFFESMVVADYDRAEPTGLSRKLTIRGSSPTMSMRQMLIR